MNILTPKAAASTLVGVGSMGGGGGAVYLYQLPTNWKELLTKEGYVFLTTDEDYKGMFNDQQNDSNWTTESELSDAKETDVNTKAKNYCQGKFTTKLPSSSDKDYATTKQKLILFCTTEGIKTVKARLIQNKQGQEESKKWIGESGEDEKWKGVFAIYRYNNDFIKWLKEGGSNDDLSKDSKPSEKYSVLKNACSALLKKNHREITNNKYFNYGSWWCVELGYKTIKEKIQKEDSTWEERPESDSGWGNLKTQWENTEQVKKWAKKAKSSSEDSSEDLDEAGLKALCKGTEDDKGVKSKISDDDSYQEKYLVIKKVCKKENSTE